MGRPRKSLEDAINNVLYQLDDIVEKTAKDVGRKLKKDMIEQSEKVVKHYYDNYRPEKFDRNYALYHSYNVFDNTKGNKVSVSVEFDPNLIKGEHKSNSRYHETGDSWEPIVWPWEQPKGNNYGVPEPDWIINNFWDGIHPRSYGNKYIGFKYSPVVDMKSPQDLLIDFVNGSYVDKVLKPYANDILTDRVIKALRQQFR